MKLSVALCTYNGEKFIREQIDSILNQKLKIDEIIICDDRSSDNTIQILRDYELKNPDIFKIHQNKKNLRSVKNFEKAITLCTGDVIFLSDQDDIWSLNKTKDYINYFNSNPTISVIASNGYCIDEKSIVTEKYAIWDAPQFLKEKEIPFNYHKLICCIGNLATGASIAFRKELIPEIMPFPQIPEFHHDEWIAMVSSLKNKFVLLNEKYFYYRIHKNQQIGGVFHDKTENKKNDLTFMYDMSQKQFSFTQYKQRLKKLCLTYQKNQKIASLNNEYAVFFNENTSEIEQMFHETKKSMEQSFPLYSKISNYIDKILNKRQLK